MFSGKKVRLVVSIVSAGMLGLVCAASHAGRSVRTDAGDSFDIFGAFWGNDSQDFQVTDGVTAGRTEFKLNFGNSSGARFYTVCMSVDGFIRFITNDTCETTDFALPPTRPYIAVFATDLETSNFSTLTRTRGFVDTAAPYRLWQAAPAQRFWWSGVSLAGDGGVNTFDVQIVLLDRSKGKNNGDFDIEFNYGIGGDTVPPAGTESNPNAAGFQGFKLGPNSRGPVLGPFGPFDTNGAPIRFCFRNGQRTSC
jgi:hypothetical protein